MALDVWRIESPEGIGHHSTVYLNGKQLCGVRAVSVNVQTDDVVTATLVVENVEVQIGALKPTAVVHAA